MARPSPSTINISLKNSNMCLFSSLRYISEWNVVATLFSNWAGESRKCGDFHPVHGHVGTCPFTKMQNVARKKKKPTNITFEFFMNCDGNLANNRQTRMLADHRGLQCDKVNSSSTFETEQRRMLESAKQNLAQFHFFGLTEHQKENQILFENTFRVKFRESGLTRRNTYASSLISKINKDQLERVKKLNSLDIELYEFGKKIFFSRLKTIRSQ